MSEREREREREGERERERERKREKERERERKIATSILDGFRLPWIMLCRCKYARPAAAHDVYLRLWDMVGTGGGDNRKRTEFGLKKGKGWGRELRGMEWEGRLGAGGVGKGDLGTHADGYKNTL